MSLGVLIFIAAILIIVMIHESGHFLTAKLFDFKAPQFFVGFGPTIWSFKRGETEYGIKAIPAGGFVKIVGMNPYEHVPPQDQPRSYPNKPRWQRAIVLVAGSATHWIVAFVVLMVTAMTIGFPTERLSNTVASIERGSAAEEAGLEPGDRIVAIDGEDTPTWADVRRYIRSHPDEDATITVQRDDETLDLQASIGSALFDKNGELKAADDSRADLPKPKAGEEITGFLGLRPDLVYEKYSIGGAAGRSASLTWEITHRSITDGIPQIFTPVFNGQLWSALTGEGRREVDEGPIGVVGASRIAGQSAQTGRYLDLIMLIVFFTIFVGIMNLLPLPPLDGGHLAVVAWEAVTGKQVDIRKLIPVAAAVISFFVLLFLAVLYLDIARPIDIPF